MPRPDSKEELHAENVRLRDDLARILADAESVRFEIGAPLEKQAPYVLGRIRARAGVALLGLGGFHARERLIDRKPG